MAVLKITTFLAIQFGEMMVLSKRAMAYRRIMVDTKIKFFEEIGNTADKARMFVICRVMTNVGCFLSNRFVYC